MLMGENLGFDMTDTDKVNNNHCNFQLSACSILNTLILTVMGSRHCSPILTRRNMTFKE